jgi:hypothetical protein
MQLAKGTALDIFSMIKQWFGSLIDDKRYVAKIFMEKDNPILFMELVMEISSHCTDQCPENKMYRTFAFTINGSETVTREIYTIPAPGSYLRIMHNSVRIIAIPVTLDNVHVCGFKFVTLDENQCALDEFLKPIMARHRIDSVNNPQIRNNT